MKDLSTSWQKCDRSVFDTSAVDAIRTTKRREQQQPEHGRVPKVEVPMGESAQEVREHPDKPPPAEGAAASTDLPEDSWQVGFSHTFCTEGPRASKSGKNRIRNKEHAACQEPARLNVPQNAEEANPNEEIPQKLTDEAEPEAREQG